ncbi:MAG: NAD(P)H-binding protein [Chromatiales bacterium]|nr:NAD(P)H-binding protein [Chromatiales bacterium]
MFIGLAFAILPAEAQPGGNAGSGAAAQALAAVQAWVHGRYDNLDQVSDNERRDVPLADRHRPVHQLFVPVQVAAIPGWLVFQQASADGSLNPDLIMRLGLLQFLPDPEGRGVLQRELDFLEPASFHNAHLEPERLAALTLDAVRWDEDCDFLLEPVIGEERLYGEVREGACRMINPGTGEELFADDAVEITPDGYGFLGRFVNAAGEVIWGNASGELFRMKRVAPVPGTAGPILLVGATRGTGLELARELVARGEDVVAMVREGSDRSALDALGIPIVAGDALDPGQVSAAMSTRQYRVVVSSLGCRGCVEPPDYLGNRNLVDAALEHGRPLMVMVSTIGAADSAGAPPWITRWLLREAIELKTLAEEHLRASGLDYLIIRPGALRDGAPTGRGQLAAKPDTMGLITRSDLAMLIAEALYQPRIAGTVRAAIDPELNWPWDLFR